jgi:hypothetical protein
VVDEAAMIPTLQEAWQQSIRPTLTDLRGSAWFLSTPKGMNYFKVLFDLGQDSERDDWASCNTVHLTIMIRLAKSRRRVRWRLRGRRL